MHAGRTLLCAALACVLPACGPRIPQANLAGGEHWRALSPPAYGLAPALPYDVQLFQEAGPAAWALPEAHAARVDDPHRPLPRFVLNVTPEGWVLFKGSEFFLGPGAAGNEETEVSLVEALDEIQGADPAWREPDGRSRIPIVVHAERRVPWSRVAHALRVAAQASSRFRRLEVAVRGDAGHDRQLPGTFDVLMPGGVPTAGPRVRSLRLDRAEGTTRVEVDGATWTFPATDDLGAPAFLEQANAHWRAIAARLDAWRGAPAAVVHAAPGVGWAWIVKTIDLLVLRDVLEVRFPGQDLVLRFEAPPADRPLWREEPVFGWPEIAGALALALVVFLSSLPRAVRRRPRRPTGQPPTG